jgi:hypothetical protein
MEFEVGIPDEKDETKYIQQNEVKEMDEFFEGIFDAIFETILGKTFSAIHAGVRNSFDCFICYAVILFW